MTQPSILRKLVGLMPARNEDWCLGLTARAAMMWLDELVILNHASTDRTGEMCAQIACEFPGRIEVLFDADPQWNEMAHRQRLLEAARGRGATHIAMVDADEILTGNLLAWQGWIGGVDYSKGILRLPWICLARSLDRYYSSGVWGDNKVCVAFRDSPEAHWKARDGYDFHHRHPMGVPQVWNMPLSREQGGLMHLQFLSERRLRAKQALYKVTEVLRWPGRSTVAQINALYDRAVYESALGRADHLAVPSAWWEPYAGLMQHLDMEAEPWQEREVQRIVSDQTDRARWRGLDLFGVA